MGRFLGNFGHPHRVEIGVEAVEGRCFQIQLIAQHDDQIA